MPRHRPGCRGPWIRRDIGFAFAEALARNGCAVMLNELGDVGFVRGGWRSGRRSAPPATSGSFSRRTAIRSLLED
jgi:hypothetical protein